MKKRVVITGLGLISPLGNDVSSFWENALQGKSGISRIQSFNPQGFDSQIAGEVKDFNCSDYITAKELKRMENFVQYAIAAAYQAIKEAAFNLDEENLERIGVLVGSGIGSLRVIEQEHKVLLEKGPSRVTPFLIPMLIVNEAAGQIAIKLKLKGPNSCVATACASGTHAIGDAFKIIQRGDAEAMLAGGTESAITPLGVAGFCGLKALSKNNDRPQAASRPFDQKRDGFVMAEGSGIVVMESLEHAQKRNAFIYAEVLGYGMSSDAYHITAPDPDGDGAARAMRAALEDSGLKPQDIDYINAHGTSTVLNDKVETQAIKRVFKDYAKNLAISSTKSMTGHLLGAAGGLELIVCCLSIRDNIVPPTINYEYPDPECDLDYVPNNARKMQVDAAMSNSLGFGGHNATLIVKKFTG